MNLKITTKYNIGNQIYIYLDDKVETGVITNICIRYVSEEKDTAVLYQINNKNPYVPEEKIYTTVQHLIEAITPQAVKEYYNLDNKLI